MKNKNKEGYKKKLKDIKSTKITKRKRRYRKNCLGRRENIEKQKATEKQKDFKERRE